MNASEPSLFRLFSRSRYRTILPGGGDSEVPAETELRSERERFATAAVAFCLKHSPEFRQHFWRTICRTVGDSPEAPELIVALEPPAWADLRLIAEAPSRTVWVIEFKLDAELADKQDPTKPNAFCEPRVGYGALFSASELPGTDRRYVILGSRRLFSDHVVAADLGGVTDQGIRWQARRWRDLAEKCSSPDSLTSDLFSSLGQLGIGAFRMKEIKSLVVAGDFRPAADAWDVLVAVGSEAGCGFRSDYWKIAVEKPDESHFSVGAYLKPPPPKMPTSKLHRRLAEAVGGSDNGLAWVGYEAGPTIANGPRRSIWFYCGTQVQADSLRLRLFGKAKTGEPDADGGGLNVIATDVPGETLKDLEWFSSVLGAAAE